MSIEDLRKRYEASPEEPLKEDLSAAFDFVVAAMSNKMKLSADLSEATEVDKEALFKDVMNSFNILYISETGSFNDPEVRVFENLSDEDQRVILDSSLSDLGLS